jgi:hypothetical protein
LGYGAFGLLLLVRRGSLLSEYQISGIKKSLNFQCQPLPIAFVMDFLTVTLSGEFIPSTDSLTKFQDVGGGGVIIASILLLCGKANWGQERGGGGGGVGGESIIGFTYFSQFITYKLSPLPYSIDFLQAHPS